MNSVAFQHHRQSEHVIRFSFLSYFARISVSDGVAEGGEVGRKAGPPLAGVWGLLRAAEWLPSQAWPGGGCRGRDS